MWSIERPTTPGFYWCLNSLRTHCRVVQIWKYPTKYDLYTNEHNELELSDCYYDDSMWWSNPVIPPDFSTDD